MNVLSRSTRVLSLIVGAPLLAASFAAPRSQDVPLTLLDLTKMRVQPMTGRGAATAQNVAQANKSIDGNPIRIGGKEFAEGVGTRATSVLFVDLAGLADRFSAVVGADDNPLPPPPARAGQPPAAPPPPAPAPPTRKVKGPLETNL